MKWIYELNVGDVLPFRMRTLSNAECFDLVTVEHIANDLVTARTRYGQPVYFTMDGYERFRGVAITLNYLMQPTPENIAKAKHNILARALKGYFEEQGSCDELSIETLQQMVTILGLKTGLEDL